MAERRMREMARACVAGLGAVSARAAATTVFHAGGHHLLDESARRAARTLLDLAARSTLGALMPAGLGALAGQGTQRVMAAAQAVGGARFASVTGHLLQNPRVAGAIGTLSQAAEQAASQAVEQAAEVMKPGLGRQASAVVRSLSSGAQVAAAARRTAVIGAVIDGVSSGVEATRAVQRGEWTTRQAVVRVGIEAGTGALAAGAGVALGAGAVAVLGTIGAPVLFVVGAAGSIGTKRALRWLFDAPESGDEPALTPSA